MDYEATATYSSPLPPRPPSSSAKPSSRSSAVAEYLLSEGRFLPGRLLAGRYRIIALLGKGGMGEVYRADDLTLGQAVAMKFLPDEATSNEGLLERFNNEVRIARRVSHPNVCRVYDVGDVDGQTFFTMEYVDGEDLASCCAASAASRKTKRSKLPANFARAWPQPITKACFIAI